MDQEQTTPSGEVATGMTEDQAAQALLEQWGVKDEGPKGKESKPSPEGEDEPDESEDQPEGDDTEDEPEGKEEPEESGEIEIDVAGEKFKLPPALAEQAKRIEAKAKEVEAGATRKFQEAAEVRKAAEHTATQASQQQQFNEAQSHLLGQLAMVDARLATLEKIDVDRLGNEDPVALTKLNAEYNQLITAKGRIGQAFQQAHALFEQDQQRGRAERLKAVGEFAKSKIKDWGTNQGQRHADYAAKQGLSKEDVQRFLMMDERLLLILDDAEYGARVRASKPEPKKQAASNSTLKPGAGGSAKTTAAQKADKTMERLKKTGSVEDAAMALLARSNARRK